MQTILAQIDAQIERGRSLRERQPRSAEDVKTSELDEGRWVDFVREILGRSFSTDHYAREFRAAGGFGTVLGDPGERWEVCRDRITHRVNALQSIRDRLELIQELSIPADKPEVGLHSFSLCLHGTIIEKCELLFQSEHYAEAVERSFKVVRDRLRTLTGHERGADAFGTGKLHIKGAIANHVDKDFNEGVKFFTMAIDMFRNEKATRQKSALMIPLRRCNTSYGAA
jgi:uncharacterized protein (TIGR02391 family)